MLKELPGDLRVALDERSKVPHRHHVAMKVGNRSHRGRANAIADERDFAEVAARAETFYFLSIDGRHAFALGNDEETDPTLVAFADHGCASRKGPFAEGLAELLEVATVQPRKERNLFESVCRIDRHAMMLHVARHTVNPIAQSSRTPRPAALAEVDPPDWPAGVIAGQARRHRGTLRDREVLPSEA